MRHLASSISKLMAVKLAFFFLSLSTPAMALGIVNGDFETGTLTGWTVGRNVGTAKIVSQGSAPNTNGQLSMVHGGNYAAQLYSGHGDLNWRDYARITQTITIPTGICFTSMSFWFAGVMEGAHSVGQDSYIAVTVSRGSTIIYYSRYEAAGDPSAVSVPNSTWKYLPWRQVSTPINGMGGQVYTLKFEAHDCEFGAHSSYAYIDDVQFEYCPTFTVTPTDTQTSTATVTPTSTISASPTPTRTLTGTPTRTNTPSFTSTPSATQTDTETSTETSTSTATPTATASETSTDTVTPTPGLTESQLASRTTTPGQCQVLSGSLDGDNIFKLMNGITAVDACSDTQEALIGVDSTGKIYGWTGGPTTPKPGNVMLKYTAASALNAVAGACVCGVSVHYAVGANGLILSDAGGAWSPVGTAPVTGVNLETVKMVSDCSGESGGYEVWIGGQGILLHRASSGVWSSVYSGTVSTADIRSLAVTTLPDGSEAVVAVGSQSGAAWAGVFNAYGFAQASLPAGAGPLNAVADLGNGSAMAVGQQGTALVLTPGGTAASLSLSVTDLHVSTNPNIVSISAISWDNVIAGLADGNLLTYDGTRWVELPTNSLDAFHLLYTQAGYHYAICTCDIVYYIPCPNPQWIPLTPTASASSTLANTATSTPCATPTPTFTPCLSCLASATASPQAGPGSPTPTPTFTLSGACPSCSASATPGYASATVTPTFTPWGIYCPTCPGTPGIGQTWPIVGGWADGWIWGQSHGYAGGGLDTGGVGGGPGGDTGGSGVTCPVGGYAELYDLCCTCCLGAGQGGNAWAVGSCSTIVRYEGTSRLDYHLMFVSGTSETLVNVDFLTTLCLDYGRFWAAGSSGTVVFTGDDGATWTTVLDQDSSLWAGAPPRLVSIRGSVNGDTIYLISNDGRIWVGTNATNPAVSAPVWIALGNLGLPSGVQLGKGYLDNTNPAVPVLWMVGSQGTVLKVTGLPFGPLAVTKLDFSAVSPAPAGGWAAVTFNSVKMVNGAIWLTGDHGVLLRQNGAGWVREATQGWTYPAMMWMNDLLTGVNRLVAVDQIGTDPVSNQPVYLAVGDGIELFGVLRTDGTFEWVRVDIVGFVPVGICGNHVCTDFDLVPVTPLDITFPTATPTVTATQTASATRSASATASRTGTPSASATLTATSSITPTFTFTPNVPCLGAMAVANNGGFLINSGIAVDSYRSSQGAYSAAIAGSNAVVQASGAVTLNGSAQVKGVVRPNSPAGLTAIPTPLSGMVNLGALNVNAATSLAAGDYLVSSLNINSGGVLTATGGRVRLWFTGSISVNGQITSTGSIPGNFWLIGVGSAGINTNGGSLVTAVVFAPLSTANLGGSLQGALVVGNATLNSGAGLHLDQDLACPLTPTPSPTRTISQTFSASPTMTCTTTASSTGTKTSIASFTATATLTPSISVTGSSSMTASATLMSSDTATATETFSITASITATGSISSSPTGSNTAMDSDTPSPTFTPTSTGTQACCPVLVQKFGGLNHIGAPVSLRGVASDPAGDRFLVDTTLNQVDVYDSSNNYLYSFGEGILGSPWGVAIRNGKAYVSDLANSKIDIFTLNGTSATYSSSFGAAGNGNGQFQGPKDLVFNSTGELYVADSGNSRIDVFDTSLNYLKSLAPTDPIYPLNDPRGLAFDTNGDLLVVSQNQYVTVFDSTGAPERNFSVWGKYGVPGNNVHIGMANDIVPVGNGNYLLSSQWEMPGLELVDHNGNLICVVTPSGFVDPEDSTGLAVLPDGNVLMGRTVLGQGAEIYQVNCGLVASNTPTSTYTISIGSTPSITASSTASVTPTCTLTVTSSATLSSTPSATPSNSPTPTASTTYTQTPVLCPGSVASGWPMAGHDAAKSSIGEAVGPTWGVVKWQVATGGQGQPVIINSDGNPVISAPDIAVYDHNNGALLHGTTYRGDELSHGGVAFANGKMLIPTLNYGVPLLSNNLSEVLSNTGFISVPDMHEGLLSNGRELFYDAAGLGEDCGTNVLANYNGGDLAVAPDGNVYSGGVGTISLYTQSGSLIWQKTGIASNGAIGSGISADAQGRCWINGTTCIEESGKIDFSFNFTTAVENFNGMDVWMSGDYYHMALAPDGGAYVVGTGSYFISHTVYVTVLAKITAQGTIAWVTPISNNYMASAAYKFPWPQSLAVDLNGTVYVPFYNSLVAVSGSGC
jgi:hypothetical protein